MHSYKAKANPVSSYIQLSSLAMFSFAIGQNAVLMNVNGEIAIWSLIYLTEPLSLDITHKFAFLSHFGNNFTIKLKNLYCISMTYEDIVRLIIGDRFIDPKEWTNVPLPMTLGV